MEFPYRTARVSKPQCPGLPGAHEAMKINHLDRYRAHCTATVKEADAVPHFQVIFDGADSYRISRRFDYSGAAMKKWFHLVLGLLVLTSGMPHVSADAKWIKVSTAHFTMFTSNGEHRAKETLLRFEQVRTFFQQATKIAPKDDEIVQVVAFQNEREYKPYRLNAGATAYYQRTQSQDFIVMEDIEPEHYPVAVHEYTHLVVEHAGLKFPIWLNEGIAEVYSSVEPQGDKTMVGRPNPGRIQSLQNAGWMDLPTLFGVMPGSPYYTQPEKMQIFYAESWLLTHMLVLSADYRPHFGDFMAAVNGGLSSEEAFQKVYGKDLKTLMSDLRNYFTKSTVRVAILPIKLTKDDEPVQVAAADDLELRLTLTQLLIGTNRFDQAAATLAQLSKQYPESAAVEEVQMDMAFQRSDLRAAQSHCLRAFDLGSRNAQMLYNCAALSNNGGVDPKKITLLLQRALEVQPHSRDARLLLGFMLLRQDLFGQALSTFAGVKSIPPERASQFYSAEGYAMLRLGNDEEAKKAFELAKKWARTPADNMQADRFLQTFERNDPRREAFEKRAQTPPPALPEGTQDEAKQAPTMMRRPGASDSPDGQPAKPSDPFLTMSKTRGVLTKIECAGTGFRFHMSVNGQDQVFAIANPDDVQIRNTDDNETLTFSCGQVLNRAATIYFIPAADGKSNGIAKTIEFEKN